MFDNIPEIKLGLISVSRDCFIKTLSETRRQAIAHAYPDLYECQVVVENERDMLAAVQAVNDAQCNALVVFLGNFGPEAPETMIAQRFQGPVMYVAAAEDSAQALIDGRGDAYCGLLNCSYNLGLRNLNAYIPPNPVGDAQDIAAMIERFVPIARAIVGMRELKIITFGPRPMDFFACNAPIKPLFDLGVEVQENSELDLLAAYQRHDGDERIDAIVADMCAQLGQAGPTDIVEQLAQFELTLLDWARDNAGSRRYVAFANKCWPAFQTQFGFTPCYVNSRLVSRGIPVACEVDIYGALSEYIGLCLSGESVTLLDINNTVPKDMYERHIKDRFPYAPSDVFMGFHCGNTPMERLKDGRLSYQLIMKRALEPDSDPVISRGTMEGDILPGPITFYRLQANAQGKLMAYIAQGEVLPVKTQSFGSIGVFAIEEMGRFYRHVLIGGRYPHHGAVTFGHHGAALFDLFAYLGVTSTYNLPAHLPYPGENPFK